MYFAQRIILAVQPSTRIDQRPLTSTRSHPPNDSDDHLLYGSMGV